jgi:hypothetical protein
MIWILITALLALVVVGAALLPRRRSSAPVWRIDDPVVVERQVYARLYGEPRNGHVEPTAAEAPSSESKPERTRERVRGHRRTSRASA